MDSNVSRKYIKIAPKPIKNIQAPILVQGPNNKILSLQIKSPATQQQQNQKNIQATNEPSSPGSPSSAAVMATTTTATIKPLTNLITTKSENSSNNDSNLTAASQSQQQLQQQQNNQKFLTASTKMKPLQNFLTRNIENPANNNLSSSQLIQQQTFLTPTTTITLKNPNTLLRNIQTNSATATTASKSTKLNPFKYKNDDANTKSVNIPRLSSNITVLKSKKMSKPLETAPFVTIEKKIVSNNNVPPMVINNLLEAGYKTSEIRIQPQQNHSENEKVQERMVKNVNDVKITTKPMEKNITLSEALKEIQDISKVKTIPILMKSKLKQFKNFKNLRDQYKSKSEISSISQMEQQESLLKAKSNGSPQLQQSPRTKERSKSLNIQQSNKNISSGELIDTKVNRKVRKRRQSTALDQNNCKVIDLDKYLEVKTTSTPIFNQNVPPVVVTKQSNESVSPPEKKIKQMPSDGEVINILKWENGIGTTKDHRLTFHLNEYNLLEILEKTVTRNHDDEYYEKPIFEREMNSKNTSDYNDPLYFCKGCSCHGPPNEFLAPNYCSSQCIARYDRKRINKSEPVLEDPKLQNFKKKTLHRKRRIMVNSDKITNWKFAVGGVIDNQSKDVPKRIFSWTNYLSSSNAEPATIDLFLNPFPCGPNLFEVGMKLEAIDPEHSMFCVCTIAEKKGYRLKLHFDGFQQLYDFWINADSMDIFPPGWCSRTNRILQPPKNINPQSFTWSSYLIKTKSKPAPRHLFTHLNSTSTTNPFKVGMKFEADDLRNTRKVCVATVADTLDNRILVHFDGWDECYDYWVDCCSPYIHPVNWHRLNQFEIVPPPEWQGKFEWSTYFEQTNGIPATPDLFQTRDAIQFKTGMKLEIVDKKNPALIRPATVLSANQYEIKVIFDGWPKEYVFWVADDNPDIHPIGWCEATCHELEPPPGFEGLPAIMPCPMIGCRGIGNANHPDLEYHSTIDCCPYDLSNWSMELEKPRRLESADKNYGFKLTKNKTEKLQQLQQQQQHEQQLQQLPIIDIPIKQEIKSPPQPSLLLPAQPMRIEKPIIDLQLNIYKELLCDYGPRLEQNYDLWIKNSQLIKNYQKEHNFRNPIKWNVDEVAEYISNLPYCLTAAEVFRREEIDGEAFLSLRQQDLIDLLNLKLGPTIKIYSQVLHLRAQVLSQYKNEKS